MSITAPRGFAAAGVACGIKEGGVSDLAVIAMDRSGPAAGLFTVNLAAAAPVQVSRRHLAVSQTARAVVVSSGCANAGTGANGVADAVTMAAAAATLADCDVTDVLVASTGEIGPPLPVDNVATGLQMAWNALGSSTKDGLAAAEAIMTTDTLPKEAVAYGDGFVVGGMAKGAGMVRPDMATMIVVLTTDAVVKADALEEALRIAVDESFHALNIDGCPSTNDTVFALASGASGVPVDAAQLATPLSAVTWDLACQLASDAEGSSRVVTLEIKGAATAAQARDLGRALADSALVRSAFFGGDPNWGRILGALGASGIPFEPDEVAVTFEGVPVAAGGVPLDFDEDALVTRVAKGDFAVGVRVGAGPAHARVLTTDLTPDYVRFNSERS